MAKMREITGQEFEKIRYLARRLIPKKIIAEVIGYSEAGFHKRLKRDANLRSALEDNFNEGKIGLYVSQYRQAIDHYLTICKDCGKISEGEFLESCSYCDRLDPLEKGNHNNVRHKHIPANVGMLIHLGKHHLGQTDRSLVTIKTDEDDSNERPYRNFTEEQIDKKLAAYLPLWLELYGPKEDIGSNSSSADLAPDYT